MINQPIHNCVHILSTLATLWNCVDTTTFYLWRDSSSVWLISWENNIVCIVFLYFFSPNWGHIYGLDIQCKNTLWGINLTALWSQISLLCAWKQGVPYEILFHLYYDSTLLLIFHTSLLRFIATNGRVNLKSVPEVCLSEGQYYEGTVAE